MTFIVADRVQETTNSPGTGTATLLGAVSGYQSFSTGIGANNTTFYVIADQLGTNWEVGLGALNSTGTVLTRNTVYSSSNGGSTVNFATGTQYVWCDYPSSKAVIQGNPVNFSSIGATTAGTGAFTTLSASSTVSGTGFSNYFAAPPTIGNTTPNTGAFTNLSYTGTLTGGTGVVNLGSGQFYIDSSGNVGIGTSSPSTFSANSTYSTQLAIVKTDQSTTLGAYYQSGVTQYSYINAANAANNTANPLVFSNGANTERMRIDSSGNVLVTSPAGLGYGTGSGGTVTQATSKSTTVTLNKPTGQITMNNAALLTTATVSFTLSNSLMASTDIVVLTLKSGTGTGGAYTFVTEAGGGGCVINVTNRSVGTLSEALVLNFAIIKGVIA